MLSFKQIESKDFFIRMAVNIISDDEFQRIFMSNSGLSADSLFAAQWASSNSDNIEDFFIFLTKFQSFNIEG